MAGRPPKPTHLKILQGNPGKRPFNQDEPKPKSGIPAMPKWLKSYPIAVKEWKRESRELNDMGVMTTADCGTLAMRVFLAAEIQRLAAEIKVEGYTISGEEGEKRNSKVSDLKTFISEYRAFGNLLGLDPSSRVKLRAAPKKEKSSLEKFMEQKKRVCQN